MSRRGKDLENIVTTLENQLSKLGVKITSPDFIFGKISNSNREVDVSIKLNTGTTDLLIILECRDRIATQDVTWVEQLANKKEDVSANKAIAVSSSSFSVAAINTAKLKGIELRNMDQLSAEEIFSWLSLESIDTISPKVEFVDFEIIINKSETFEETSEIIKDGDKIFVNKEGGKLSVIDIWNNVVHPQIQDKLKEDGSPLTINAVITIPSDNPLYIEKNGVKKLIDRIGLRAKTYIHKDKRLITAKRRYRNTNGTLAESVEVELNDGDEKWVLDINYFPNTNQIGLVTRKKEHN